MTDPTEDFAKGAGAVAKMFYAILQHFGFPVAVCFAIGFFAYAAIQWERETMIPAIQKNTTALEMNNETNRMVRESVDALNRRVGSQQKEAERASRTE